MTASKQDIYTIALDLLEAVSDAQNEPAARERALALTSTRSADEMRRVAALLAVLCGRRLLTPELRGKLPAWIERMRFAVLTYAVDPDSGIEA